MIPVLSGATSVAPSSQRIELTHKIPDRPGAVAAGGYKISDGLHWIDAKDSTKEKMQYLEDFTTTPIQGM